MKLRDDLADLKPYTAGVLRPGVLKLASNENPLGPSPRALEAVAKAASRVSVYPDGSAAELRQALSRHLGVAVEQILVGNGSDEVLTLVTGAYFKPGDEGIGADITFSQYQFAVRLFGGTWKVVPLRGGAFDLEAMAAAIGPRTKMVFVCNPNNPTGTMVSHDELVHFLEHVPPNVLAVIDEAYVHYVRRADFPDTLSLLNRFPNLLISQTFSKVYGLAALRIGYALAQPEVIRHLSVVRQPFNVGTLSQAAAAAALDDQDFVSRSQSVNAEGVVFWERALDELKLIYYPTQANFIAISVRRDSKAVFEAMASAGVTIRPLASFGLPTWIRITIGTAEHNQLCLTALKKALSVVEAIPSA